MVHIKLRTHRRAHDNSKNNRAHGNTADSARNESTHNNTDSNDSVQHALEERRNNPAAPVGVPVNLPEVRVRFNATLRAADLNLFTRALIASANDVPLLLAEVERQRRTYADLVAACRAGLLADDEAYTREDRAAAWAFIVDELPDPPPGHPLHDTAHYPATGNVHGVGDDAENPAGIDGGYDTGYDDGNGVTRAADTHPFVDPVIYPNGGPVRGGGVAYE